MTKINVTRPDCSIGPTASLPTGGIIVTEEGGPQSMDGYEFLQPNLENLKGLSAEEISKARQSAKGRSVSRAQASAEMAKLPKGISGTPAVELARYRTLSRRRDMTPFELGMWEALRDPVTGIPPQDVRGTPGCYVVSN